MKKGAPVFIMMPVESIPGCAVMVKSHEKDLKFTSTWGGKLEQDVLTTFRGQDKVYTVGSIYPVSLVAGIFHKKKDYGPHQLIRLEFKRIRDITDQEITQDIGAMAAGKNPKANFYAIMKAFYFKKAWWDGEYTILQKLTLEKLGKKELA